MCAIVKGLNYYLHCFRANIIMYVCKREYNNDYNFNKLCKLHRYK